MCYKVKIQPNAGTGRQLCRMVARIRADDRDRATELELDLPARVTSPVEAGRFERLWGQLFNHGVGPQT